MGSVQKINPFEKKILKQALLEWWAHPRLPLDRVLSETFREHRVGQQQRALLSDKAFMASRVWAWMLGVDVKTQTPQEIRAFDEFLESLLARDSEFFFKKHTQIKPLFDKNPLEHLRIVHGVPDILLSSWNFRNHDELLALHEYLHSGFRSAPLCIRVNTLKTNRDDLLAKLSLSVAKKSTWSEDGISFDDRVPLTESEDFDQGLFDIQDEHSQMIAQFLPLKKGMKILDMCAGAGGKTLHMASLMGGEGEIHAYDLAQDKLKRLQERARRQGLNNIRLLEKLPSKLAHHNTYDLVLIDAPCSSLGTLRRNPDRILKWSEQEANEISQTQSELFLGAKKWVRPGGFLAYATCTLRPQENALKVDSLIKDDLASGEWTELKPSEMLPSSWDASKKSSFFENLEANPAYRLRGVSRPVLQWGPDAHISGTFQGDAFFLALYNKRE